RPRIVPRRADGKETPAHARADFVARLASDEDHAAAHPRPAAAVGGTDQVSGVTVNVDLAAAHLGADPVAGISMHDDVAAAHLGTDVHANRTLDGDPATGHASSDPLDARAIAFDDDLSIPGIPLDTEELAQSNGGVAVLHGKGRDLGERLASEVV